MQPKREKRKLNQWIKERFLGSPRCGLGINMSSPLPSKAFCGFSPPTPFVFKKAYFKKRNCSSNTVHGMERIPAEMDLRHLKSLIF